MVGQQRDVAGGAIVHDITCRIARARNKCSPGSYTRTDRTLWTCGALRTLGTLQPSRADTALRTSGTLRASCARVTFVALWT
jgi:hypothetical protein